MKIEVFNITQFVDTTQPPFRQAVIDYSHMDYSDILDAVASSVLMLSLTAILLQVPSVIYGFSTRCLVIRSLYERSLLPDVIFAIKAMFQSIQPNRKHSSFLLYVVAGSLQLLLLTTEAVVIFSSTQKLRSISFENLRFRGPKFVPYNGSPVSMRFPTECPSFFSSKDSLVVPANSLCVSQSFSALSSKRQHAIEIRAGQEKSKGRVGIQIVTNYVQTLSPFVWFQTTGERDELVFLNTTSTLENPSMYTHWLGQHIVKLFNCSSLNQPVGQPKDFVRATIDNCTLHDDEKRADVTRGIVISSLQLSNIPLSRDDFSAGIFVAEHDNFTYQPGRFAKSVDWDVFVQYQTSRVLGYWVCIGAFLLFIINFFLGALAPDIQLVKAVAVMQHLRLPTLPLYLHHHIPVHLQNRGKRYQTDD